MEEMALVGIDGHLEACGCPKADQSRNGGPDHGAASGILELTDKRLRPSGYDVSLAR